MPEIPLVVDAGREHGSPASRRLRGEGKIPAVVYGHGIDPISVAVDGRALRTALGTPSGTNALLRLEIDGAHHLALAREIQRHPVRHTVTHVDFQVVNRDEVAHFELPVVLVGEAEEVARGDGSIDQELFSLPVKAKPGDLPPNLEVDISGLSIGDVVRLGDVSLPDGVTTELDPETALAVAHAPRVQEVEVGAAAEEAAGEAGEGGEAAGGAEAAGSGDAAGAADTAQS